MSARPKPCDKVAYMTVDQAKEALGHCLRAAMLGQDRRECAGYYCAECAAFHLTSRPSRDDAPLVRGVG